VEILEEQAKPLDAVRPIGDFYFAHPENPKAGLMAYGLMSFCNHAQDANADMRWSRHEKLGWIAELVAVKSIREGDEITYRYKCPLWFSDNR
jgi:SET domain-containing protein